MRTRSQGLEQRLHTYLAEPTKARPITQHNLLQLQFPSRKFGEVISLSLCIYAPGMSSSEQAQQLDHW